VRGFVPPAAGGTAGGRTILLAAGAKSADGFGIRRASLAAAVCWAALNITGMAVHRPFAGMTFFPQGIDAFKPAVFAAVWGRRLFSFAALAGWLAALFAWGRPASGFLGMPVVATGISGLGFGLAGLMVLGFGLAGLLHPLPLAVAFLVPLAFVPWRGMPRTIKLPTLADGGWKLAVMVPVLLALPAMLSPEGSWDAMVYHLRLPSFALMEHKWFLVGDSPFASYPPLVEFHYLLALGLTGLDDLPKLMHAACWLLTARLIFAVAIPAGRTAAWGSVLLWLLSPLGMHLAGMAYVDHATAWLTALSVAFVLRTGRVDALAAGLFAGFAFLTKYTGGFAVIGVLACLLARPRRAGSLLLATAGIAAAALPWLARNYLCFGNPVYPFLNRMLGGMPSATVEYWRNPVPVLMSVNDYFGRPWTGALADDGGVGAVLSPLWLAVLLPAAGFGLAGRATVFFAAAGLVWWAMPLDSRFLFPLVPAALISAVPAWSNRGFAKVALCAILGLSPFCLREAAFASFRQFDTLPPALGLRAREDHLRNGLTPQPEYWDSAMEINRVAPRRARVMLLCGIKTYYVDRRCSTDHQHINPVPLLRELRMAGSLERLVIRLRQGNYAFLWYQHRATIAASRSDTARLTDREADLYVAWLRTRTEYAFRAGEALVYSLRSAPGSRKLGRVPLLEEAAMTEVTDGRAGTAARQLSRLAPESSSCAMARGVGILLNPSLDPSAARSPLSAAVASPEASSIAWRAYGFVLERAGETTGALTAYRVAVGINPGDPDARGSLARLSGRASGIPPR